MKKLLALILSALLFCSCAEQSKRADNPIFDESATTTVVEIIPKAVTESDDTYENTTGNFSMFGYVAYNDGWIYYRLSDGLYKIREDGTEKTKINDREASDINVINGYIYYTDFNNETYISSIYKVRIDGTDEVVLLQEQTGSFSNVTVVGDWVYYKRNARTPTVNEDFEYDADDFVHRMKTDGSENTKLNDIRSQEMNISDGWIYYLGYIDWEDNIHGGTYIGDVNIYKMRLDGSENMLLVGSNSMSVDDDDISSLIVGDDWIYFSTSTGSEAIFKMRKDGTEKTKVCGYENGYARTVNISGNWLYYYDFVPVAFSGELCRINDDGIKEKILLDCDDIYILNEWIYYYTDNELYKMRLDGTENQRAEKADKPASDFDYRHIDGGIEITAHNGSAADVRIPAKIDDMPVISIGKMAFMNNTELETVILPNNVKTIDQSAFQSCFSLKSINLENVARIYGNAFLDCKLTEVIFSDSLVSVECNAFWSCSQLSKITFPDKFFYLDSGSFLDTAWEKAQPDGVIYAGNMVYGYKGDQSKATIIELREGTLGIVLGAFKNNSSSLYSFENLTKVIIPDGVTYIGGQAFWECEALEEVIIPDSVTYVGGGAFYDTAWFNSQPDGVVYINKIAYDYAGDRTAVMSIKILDGTVGKTEGAFAYTNNGRMDSLTSVTLPDSLTWVGE